MKRLANLGAMAPVGVGPGVAKPTPGDELSVGEALTKKRQDLAEFMGCSIEVVDDLEALTAGEKVKVKICGTHADGSELEGSGGAFGAGAGSAGSARCCVGADNRHKVFGSAAQSGLREWFEYRCNLVREGTRTGSREGTDAH